MGPARPGPMLGFLAYGLRKSALRTRHVTEVSEVADGDVLDLPGAPVVVGLPGHSPGSIAVHVPAVGAVFVGDALTTRHVLTGRRARNPPRSPTSPRKPWPRSTASRHLTPRGSFPAMVLPGAELPPTSPPRSAPTPDPPPLPSSRTLLPWLPRRGFRPATDTPRGIETVPDGPSQGVESVPRPDCTSCRDRKRAGWGARRCDFRPARAGRGGERVSGRGGWRCRSR